MGEGIKSTIIDKLVDELLNSVIGKSQEEITQIINQSKLQKILLHVIDKFAKSDIFNIEFKHYTYVPQRTLVLQVESSKIDIKLSLDELKNNIEPIIKECFSSDEKNYKLLTEYICASYIQQASLTVSIVDILEVQKENYKNLMSGIDKFNKIILESQQRELDLQARKIQLAKSILRNELAHSTTSMMEMYLYFIHKKSVLLPLNNDVTQKGMIRAQCQVIRETLEKMNDFINNRFCMEPIKLTICNSQVQKSEKTVPYFQFCEYYFTAQINREIDKLIKYDRIIPENVYITLLEIKNLVESDIFPPICSQGFEEYVVTKGVELEAQAMISVLTKLGKELLELSGYII